MLAVDQKQQRSFDPGRWHEQRRCGAGAGHLEDGRLPSASSEPQSDCAPWRFAARAPPTAAVDTNTVSRRLPSTSAFAASALFHSIISFIPSAPHPPWLYFTAQRLQHRDTRSHGPEMNVWAPGLPPFLLSLMWRTRWWSRFWPAAWVVFAEPSPSVPLKCLRHGGGQRGPFCPMDGWREQWSFFIFPQYMNGGQEGKRWFSLGSLKETWVKDCNYLMLSLDRAECLYGRCLFPQWRVHLPRSPHGRIKETFLKAQLRAENGVFASKMLAALKNSWFSQWLGDFHVLVGWFEGLFG